MNDKRTTSVKQHPRKTPSGKRTTVKRHIRNNRAIRTEGNVETYTDRQIEEKGIVDVHTSSIDIIDGEIRMDIIGSDTEPIAEVVTEDEKGQLIRITETEQDGDKHTTTMVFSQTQKGFDKERELERLRGEEHWRETERRRLQKMSNKTSRSRQVKTKEEFIRYEGYDKESPEKQDKMYRRYLDNQSK